MVEHLYYFSITFFRTSYVPIFLYHVSFSSLLYIKYTFKLEFVEIRGSAILGGQLSTPPKEALMCCQGCSVETSPIVVGKVRVNYGRSPLALKEEVRTVVRFDRLKDEGYGDQLKKTYG